MPRLPTLGHRLTPADTRTARPAPKVAAPIYGTEAHRDWRAEVLRRAGNACQACGRSGVRLFADHVRELRDGGSATDPANGQALCQSCHGKKTAAERAKRMAK